VTSFSKHSDGKTAAGDPREGTAGNISGSTWQFSRRPVEGWGKARHKETANEGGWYSV